MKQYNKMDKKYYMLVVSTYCYGCEEEDVYFFKTEIEAKEKEKEEEQKVLKINNKLLDVKYSIYSEIIEKSFTELKELMTVSEFEQFFGINITADGKIVKEN